MRRVQGRELPAVQPVKIRPRSGHGISHSTTGKALIIGGSRKQQHHFVGTNHRQLVSLHFHDATSVQYTQARGVAHSPAAPAVIQRSGH